MHDFNQQTRSGAKAKVEPSVWHVQVLRLVELPITRIILHVTNVISALIARTA
jgi:hypothetical protein